MGAAQHYTVAVTFCFRNCTTKVATGSTNILPICTLTKEVMGPREIQNDNEQGKDECALED